MSTDSDTDSDSDIVKASLDAPRVFEEVWRRHAPAVFRYAVSRLDDAAAEDVLSATFLIAFKKRSKFDQSRPDALPWLLGIATNEIHRHRRTEARALAVLDRVVVREAVEPLPDVDDRVDARQALRDAGETLRAMPERDRDVLLLHAWADLDYAAIGVALNIPIGTVRSRLNRARRILRAAHPTRLDGEPIWTN